MPNISIVAGLALRNELNEKIAREEVEEMHRVVTQELAQIRPGCISTITGGYVGFWLILITPLDADTILSMQVSKRKDRE